jgi:hypothetical protein
MSESSSDPTNPISVVVTIASNVVSTVRTGIANLPVIVEIAQSTYVLLWTILAIALIVFLIFSMRPVVPAPCHSFDFESFMNDEYLQDFARCVRVFRAGIDYADNVLRGNVESIVPPATSKHSEPMRSLGRIREVGSGAADVLIRYDDVNLAKNMRVYFNHYRCLCSDAYKTVCNGTLVQVPEFREPGKGRKVNQVAVDAFEAGFVRPVEMLRNACYAISACADGAQGLTDEPWYVADPQRAFAWLTAVHKLRMYLNEYHEQIVFSSMSRANDRFFLNSWILYYFPYVIDIFQHRIPEVWRAWPARFLSYFKAFREAWTRLGNIIANLPCNIAFATKPENRAKYCNLKMFKTYY